MSMITARFKLVNDLLPNAGTTIVRQFETICRTILRGPDVTNTRDYLLYITHEPHPFGNFAVVSDPTNINHTQSAIAPLQSLNAPTAVIFPGNPSKQVESLVRDRGYELAESMAAMAVHIDAMATPSLPPDYSFMEVTSLQSDPAWCNAFAAGYGIPQRVADDFGPRIVGDLFTSRTIRYFAITKRDEIVCTSTIFLEGGIAGVYCVSTLPDHRGKGLAAFITAQGLRQVRSIGYQTGILQSSAMGESVYRRLGFQSFGAMPLYVRTPAGFTFAH